jgi:hypothetical protein
MSKRHPPVSATLIAGVSCTAIAIVGSAYFVVVTFGWLPADLIEPIARLIVGTVAITLAALSLWFGIRLLNSRDDPGRVKPAPNPDASPKSD